MLTNKDRQRISDLFILAKFSEFPRIKIAASLYAGNEYLGYGINSLKTHPYQKQLDLKHRKFESRGRLHAETLCLLPHLDKDLSKCTIYVARQLTKFQRYGMCRPCGSCHALIREKRIGRIVFSTESGICVEYLS